MPELPEVETYRRTAERHVTGRRIRAVHTVDPAMLRNTTPQGLGRAVTGATLDTPRRTGKWVALPTDATSDLVVHFGMTGAFRWLADGERPGSYDHVQLAFDDGVLVLRMPRKLGGVWIARDDEEREEITGRLGLDAWSVDADDLRARLAGSRAGLKSALMDQSKIAGVGNLLSDEICWQVCVHPAARCVDLPDAVWDRVADALTRALDTGVDMGHVPTADGFLLDVRRDDDARCPRCGAALQSSTVAGRTSVWCPTDQTSPD